MPSLRETMKGIDMPSLRETMKGIDMPSLRETMKGIDTPSLHETMKGIDTPSLHEALKGIDTPSLHEALKGIDTPSLHEAMKGIDTPSLHEALKASLRVDHSLFGEAWDERLAAAVGRLETRAEGILAAPPEPELKTVEALSADMGAVIEAAPAEAREDTKTWLTWLLVFLVDAIAGDPAKEALRHALMKLLVVLFVMITDPTLPTPPPAPALQQPDALAPVSAPPEALILPGGWQIEGLPDIVLRAGPQAAERTVEFFTAQIRNPHTRAAYGTSVTRFLQPAEARQLLDAIDTSTLPGLRDRALLGVMVYSFARVSAVVGMRVEDYYQQGKRWWLRLQEKGGKHHAVPVHHKAEAYLDAYLDAAGIAAEKSSPLWRSMPRAGGLGARRMSRVDVFRMIKRRVKAIGLGEANCHTFRATGITAYLLNGGTLERAQAIAAHESPRTTKLYDRTADEVTIEDIEKIEI